MGYFNNFPLIITVANGKNIVITDFFRRTKFGSQFNDISAALVPYLVLDGETPDLISNKFYGSPYYHWIVLGVNNIVNYYLEWPLKDSLVFEYTTQTYGSGNEQSIHHYLDSSSGNIVDSSFAGIKIPITNYEYELSINDAKRNIRILDPQYLGQVVSEFNTIIGA